MQMRVMNAKRWAGAEFDLAVWSGSGKLSPGRKIFILARLVEAVESQDDANVCVVRMASGDAHEVYASYVNVIAKLSTSLK